MGFEAFEVYLYPIAGSPMGSTIESATLSALVSEMQTLWPEFRSDTVEIAHLFKPLSANAAILVYETSEGLLQLGVHFDPAYPMFALGFAYCNPRSVDGPFCAITEGLMQRYGLYCHIHPDLAPEQEGISVDIVALERVRAVLIPSIEYNRKLWHSEVGTEEEAILRPGDAVARFMTPLLMNNP